MSSFHSASLPHDSAALYVTGQAQFIDDIALPADTVHVALGLSDIAHGIITDMDFSSVLQADGVIGVLTHHDIPGKNDASPVFGDDPIFTSGRIDYHGQAIFAVVAKSAKQARKAALLANITTTSLPPIITIDEALAANNLLQAPKSCVRGDATQALAEAPYHLEGVLRLGGQEHFYLEGQAAIAIPGEMDGMSIFVSSQHPTEIQHKVADALDVPYGKVTVEVRRMGGAFGGKESQANLPAIIAALAAQKTGKPAKCVYDRDEDMRVTGKRHDCKLSYDVGYDETGRILALDLRQALRCGMSFDLSAAVADRAVTHADNAYFIPHIKVTSYMCRTNTPSNTAFRGFGGPQGMAAIERIMDEIAFALGKDPLEVRLLNLYAEADSPDAGQLTPYGQPVTDCILRGLMGDLAKTSDYQNRRAAIEAYNKTNPHIRRGIGLTPVKFGISFNKTMLNQAGALVHVYTDGSVHLNHGGTEMGQGLYTKVRQICAHEFGIEARDVHLSPANTGKVPNSSATAASSGTDLNGMAAAKASAEIKARMTAYLAQLYQCDEATIHFNDGHVVVGQDRITFAEAAQLCWQGRISLSSTGFYATPDIYWDADAMQGCPFYYYAYGAAVTEVAIDRVTGETRILKTDILHDAGHSINPALDIGQIEGGFVQGAGWLTSEELVYGADGALQTHAPSTYKIPACSDRPVSMSVKLYESGGNKAETIHRSKAVGEPPFMLSFSVLSALCHALSSTGKTFPSLHAPATPEAILRCVRDEQS